MICDSIKDNSVVRRMILDEFYYQSKNSSYIIALQSVEAIKNCGLERSGIEETSKSLFYPSIKYLVRIVKSNKDDRVLGHCVQSLHQMLLKDREKTADVVYYLVSMIDRINSPPAKARIIRLIIDFIEHFKTIARETFRKLVKNFTAEKLPVKFQIIQLGVTLMQIKFEGAQEKLERIFAYVIQLGLSDADYGLKVFTRMVKGIFEKDSLCGDKIDRQSAFLNLQKESSLEGSQSKIVESKADLGGSSVGSEYKDVELENQESLNLNFLEDIDNHFIPSLSSVLNLPNSDLKVELCSEDQQTHANEFIFKTGPSKDLMFSHSIHSEGGKQDHGRGSKAHESVGKFVSSNQ